ncbi:hypothetical protein BJY04DRAFT_218913 [Aspergillus karnatakaensis]|uniref:fungal specific transcription factor domain-containing protein n=1 Tax=Aspergillus karnatakaensis TaxID=1810916 RepID=UPI003CCCC891
MAQNGGPRSTHAPPLIVQSERESSAAQTQATPSKAASLCSRLRAALPSYDMLLSTLSQGGSWWSSYRQKAYTISQAPPETIEAFAKRVYTSQNPAELGSLALAFARSSDSHYSLYTFVDELILSDFTMLATIEGIQCLILLAKLYTDTGYPKKAWLAWRKGVTAVQFMGLCKEKNPAIQLQLWSSVYHGDRFCSLLLGLPYGLHDIHCAPIIEVAKQTLSLAAQFVLQCAVISGRIIDRNLNPAKLSFAKAIEMDEELEALASPLPDSWWALPAYLPEHAAETEMDTLRERLLQQFYFYWVRVYLHLPFLTKSDTTSPNATSRTICIEAARQVLRRYRLLRGRNSTAKCLFKCKTTDFACFTVAIVLLIGLFHSDAAVSNPRVNEDDLALIAAVDSILHTEECEKNCALAAQCRKTLRVLSETAGETREVVIPYFGVVVRRPPHRPSIPRPSQPTDFELDQGPDIPGVDGLWTMDAYSLEYFNEHALDSRFGLADLASFQDDIGPLWESTAAALDLGWDILDFNADWGGDIDIP